MSNHENSGGNNAGHTVVVGDKKYDFHLLPSSIIHQGYTSVIVFDRHQQVDGLQELKKSKNKSRASRGGAPEHKRNYIMKVGIITCMLTCMFAVALTEEVPIRRLASQSEKTALIGGNVTLLCPLVHNDLWKVVYWNKNDHTIYSLDVKRTIPWTNNTRYEGSNHATRLTIKDLQKTDSGIYNCKVETLVLVRECGQILLSVTDQEVGLSTTSPAVPFRASTTIPLQPAEDNTIFLVFLILIPFMFIIYMCLVCNYWERDKNLLAKPVSASK